MNDMQERMFNGGVDEIIHPTTRVTGSVEYQGVIADSLGDKMYVENNRPPREWINAYYAGLRWAELEKVS